MQIREEKIRAVHDVDLDKLMKNLGVLERFNNGDLRCSTCGKTITRENLGCFYAEENEVKVCCVDIECFEKVMNSRRTR